MQVSLSQRIYFFTLSCCVLFAFIIGSILWSSQRIELAFSREHYAQQVENHTNALKQLITNNDIYAYDYQADKWLLSQGRLIKLLELAPKLTAPQQTIQNSIKSQSQNVKLLFSKIHASKLKNAGDNIKRHLITRLMTQLEAIRSDSVQLSNIVKKDIHSVINQAVLFIVLTLITSVIILLYGAFRLTHIFRVSLDEVKNAFKNNHSGHFQKIELSNYSDEFDSIVKAFNAMNYKLNETTVSLAQMKSIVEERTQVLEQISKTDPLTGVANRRALYERGHLELSRKNRMNNKLTVMMLDCDFFKKINDKFGHQVGDETLKHVCNVCNQEIREIDFLARFGGEEFVILLPDCDLNSGVDIAKRIQISLAKNTLICDEQAVNVTLSIGICMLSDGHENLDQLISCADKMMYQAKENGRNRIEY